TGSFTRLSSHSAQGSGGLRVAALHARTVNRSGGTRGERSSQSSGCEIVAPARARGDPGATQVAPRTLRSVSRKIFPDRRLFAIWSVRSDATSESSDAGV